MDIDLIIEIDHNHSNSHILKRLSKHSDFINIYHLTHTINLFDQD